MIEVYDDFINKTSLENIQENMLFGNFPWFYNPFVTYQDEEEEGFQFQHSFYNYFSPKSDYIYLIDQIIEKINPVAIVRIKANLLTKSSSNIIHPFHRDFDFKCKTAVFYVNTNNGFTIFENGKKIESVENRIVIFDSNENHAGSTCTDEKCRVVINFNYIDGK